VPAIIERSENVAGEHGERLAAVVVIE